MAITIVSREAISLMTLITAVPCADRIVIAADGKVSDFETKESKPDMLKMFQLTNNSAVLIAGEGLVDNLKQYMDELIHAVRSKGNTNIVDIARDVREIIDRRNWAEWKDEREKSHLDAIVVGYDGGEPRIYTILDNRQFTRRAAEVLGGWDGAHSYLGERISLNWRQNTAKSAKKTAIEMLTIAERHNGKEVGGECAIWQVYSDRVTPLKAEDVARLRKRHGNV